LLVGLVITLAAILIDAWYMTRQISGLRVLQTDLADRSRRDSLQLLRIQNDLNSLGLAMRDMLDSEGPYPLTAWSAQFERIRVDLSDALAREEAAAVAARTPEQRQYLTASVAQFWDAVGRIFALAKDGKEQEARDEIRLSLQARQAALSTAVARLLVENNAAEEQTAARVQGIYSQVQRQQLWFVGATLTTILLMSLYLIRSNRRLFAELASLSDQRREFARQLIETRESTLHEISRELHDEFGQILTAIGLMIGRAGRHVPESSPLETELHEIREIAQTALDNVRGLSQTLHPSILEEAGLEGTIEWYLPTVERQTGLAVSYERSGPSREIPNTIAIHVYRVLQEALNNVARHSGSNRAWVRLRTAPDRLELDIEDHGVGLAPAASHLHGSSNAEGRRRGLGLVAMRERAAIVGGTIEFLMVPEGGTVVRLTVPLQTGSSVDLPPSPGSGETRRSASRGGGEARRARQA
jgi:signal transduction histidine kinase